MLLLMQDYKNRGGCCWSYLVLWQLYLQPDQKLPYLSLWQSCWVPWYRLLWSQDLRKKGWDFLHCSWIIPQFIFKHTHKRLADGYYCKCFVCKYIRGCAPGGYRTSTTQLQKTAKMKRKENVAGCTRNEEYLHAPLRIVLLWNPHSSRNVCHHHHPRREQGAE